MNKLHGVPTESIQNAKSYYCRYDCVTNLKYDVCLSLLPKYLCDAGCKFCYISKCFEKPDVDTNDIDLSDEYVKRLFKFLNQFLIIDSIDNLHMLKKRFPKLYAFYLKYSDKMSYGCLTDNAISMQYDILINEMNFRAIHEISLTDDFVSKTPDILKYIEGLNTKYSIRMIKFIYTFNDKVKSDETFSQIEKFTKTHDIDIIRHKNIMDDKYHNGIYDLSDTSFHFKPLYAEKGRIFHILGDGAIQVYYDKLKLSTDDGASSKLIPEFGTIDDLGYDLIIKLIKGKLLKYKDYVKNIQVTSDNMFYDYFKFITENLVINEKCNFIPEFILTLDAIFYEILIKDGWVATKYGLLKVSSEDEKIVPLVTWLKKDAISY